MTNAIADLQVLEDLSLITDIVIDEPADVEHPTDVAFARAFTGEAQPYWLIDPTNHSKEGLDRIKWLYDFYGELRDKGPTEANFRFSHGGYTFRGNRKAQFDGERTLTLRRIPEHAPDLSDLSLPPYYGDFLMLPDLLETGGLVLVTAPVGQGKTTTISAALLSRSKRYGGVTAMVEDPNELHLKGFHYGEKCGEIRQFAVDTRLPPHEQFPPVIHDSLRMFPQTRGNKTLFISEIRDEDTAVAACQAAQAGFTVFATLHGSNLVNVVFRLVTLLQGRMSMEAARDIVAGSLRLVAYQRLNLIQKPLGWHRGKLSVDLLYVPDASHSIANTIRTAPSLQALQDPVNQQRNILRAAADVNLPFVDVLQKLRA